VKLATAHGQGYEIVHMKIDGWLNKNPFKGTRCDALNAVMCGAGAQPAHDHGEITHAWHSDRHHEAHANLRGVGVHGRP